MFQPLQVNILEKTTILRFNFSTEPKCNDSTQDSTSPSSIWESYQDCTRNIVRLFHISHLNF